MLIDGVTCPGDAVCSLGFEGLEILGIQEVFQAVPGTATHVGAVEVRVQGHEPGAIVWPPQAGRYAVRSGSECRGCTRSRTSQEQILTTGHMETGKCFHVKGSRPVAIPES